ncbi:MAG: hypothetical protein ACR2H3_00915 [Acidimicrobiales bacterium]
MPGRASSGWAIGFFAALFNPAMEVNIWGPVSTALDLRARLSRYLSPPLFPVRLRELPATSRSTAIGPLASRWPKELTSQTYEVAPTPAD